MFSTVDFIQRHVVNPTAAQPEFEAGRVYRTRELRRWSANPTRLALRLVREGKLRRAAHGLFYVPVPSRFGPAPPAEEEILRGKAVAFWADNVWSLMVTQRFVSALLGGAMLPLAVFPESAQADNALYRVGECHFSQGNFPKAIAAFDRLLDEFPDSDMAAAGNLKKGLAYLEQNQIQLAIVQLQHVQTTFPGTDEARIATDKLTSLGASP